MLVIIVWNGASSGIEPPMSGFDDDDVRSTMRRPWRSIISADGWKLNLADGDQCELYDLNSDPYEQANQFDDSAQADRVRDLSQRIAAWQGQTNDTAPLPSL